ncbi:MAG: hypothetical protein AUH37_01060 [Candidatus Nitrososphaera sp. 13_1_40CM_48_12]|nr:MAG: hypothetical protein AUH37_01060 [Candidatus Nitrososphaera sp. 13_1_40CM_48_12]
MEILFELPMNLLGLGISAFIGRFAYSGYATVASPNLLRLTFAFTSVAIGFALLASGLFAGDYSRAITTAGLAAQAIGYFFIAFSHSLKSFDFSPHRHLLLAPLAITGFVIPGNSLEHLVRSISFILLVYVSIETMASYMQGRRTSTLMIGSGLGLLALAELLSWYNFIFPGSFYVAALSIKVAGFGLMFVPFSKFGLTSGLGRMNSQIGSGL